MTLPGTERQPVRRSCLEAVPGPASPLEPSAGARAGAYAGELPWEVPRGLPGGVGRGPGAASRGRRDLAVALVRRVLVRCGGRR